MLKLWEDYLPEKFHSLSTTPNQLFSKSFISNDVIELCFHL